MGRSANKIDEGIGCGRIWRDPRTGRHRGKITSRRVLCPKPLTGYGEELETGPRSFGIDAQCTLPEQCIAG